jgi:phosphatidylserine/phosphatidylglycerophosphate/cardiolipin synthase-like enzyme
MSRTPAENAWRHRLWRRALYAALGTLWVATAWWEACKPLPPGTRTRGPWYTMPQSDVRVISDLTAADAYGRPVMNQAIFDETLKLVHQAREFLVLDYYLFNDQHPAADPPARSLSAELRDALIARRHELPQLKVLFITDPINELDGAAPSSDLRLLRAAGVQVVMTDTERLRDANFMYSSLWRLAISWWSMGSPGTGWLPDPTDAGISTVPFGAWAQLMNLKANQRKVILGDDGHGALVGIVGSADPHDASSTQSNIAARVVGPALEPLLQSELAIARFSGWQGKLKDLPAQPEAPAPPASTTARVRVLTEGEIGEAILKQVQSADPGDSVDIAMYCIADRPLIMALLDAARRGVNVRLILDPGKDGFGKPKSGLPNQPVASELVSASDGGIHVRWYRTHGEQFHTKLVMVYGPKQLWLLVGSADLTRHALEDYDLEASVAIEVPRTAQVAQQTQDYFTQLWSNPEALGIEYTTDFPLYADPAQTHYWLYRFLEGTGWAAF